jgi:hypothetical protein
VIRLMHGLWLYLGYVLLVFVACVVVAAVWWGWAALKGWLKRLGED